MDQNKSQRTERCKSSQIKSSYKKQQSCNILDPFGSQLQFQKQSINEQSFHNKSENQNQQEGSANKKDSNFQERLTYRQTIQETDAEFFYHARCQELELEVQRQSEKVSNLLQYQQAILEQLEETSQTVQKLMQQNDFLSNQLQQSDTQYIIQQRKQQDQNKLIRQKLEQFEIRNSQLNKIIEQLEFENQNKDFMISDFREQIEGSKDRKFAHCVKQMIQVCHPPGSDEISFKQAWKWLKNVLDEYMQLKKAEQLSKNNQRPQSEMKLSSTIMGLKKSDYQSKSKERQSTLNHDSSIHIGQFIKTNRSNNLKVDGKENKFNQ